MVIRRRRSIRSGGNCSQEKRQCPFPSTVPGVFMRYPRPSANTSCMGTIASCDTDAKAAALEMVSLMKQLGP